ncbi:MAG: class I SAM-dependent methyltransferase [Bacteroidetes bacterium]|nr:class I SAM-dependent methyltransferase [Bacteroidota bacterium]
MWKRERCNLFCKRHKNVLGVDQCENEIAYLENRYGKPGNLEFACSDFSELDDSSRYDIIYSRFTMHTISSKTRKKVLKWAHRNLNTHGMFCIEVRGQKNEIFGKGEPVEDEKDAFYSLMTIIGVFLNFENLCDQLNSIGFAIDYAEEKERFAPFNNLDETFIRVIACK